MSQEGIINLISNNPQIPTQFDADVGSAIPLANILNIVGGTNAETVASGNTVTINVTGVVTSVSGTADRITISGTATDPIVDIASTYVGQNSITTVGTITTGTWNGNAIGPTFGGTGLTSYTTGDIIYASAANTLSKLPVSTDGFYLTLSGGIPAWAAVTSGVASVSGTVDRITSTGGANPVIDIAATYVGQASITTVGTISTGTWQGTVVGLAYGGTNANLTASDGGIFYSTATAGAILSGTATARQMLQSGSTAAPAWSTATWPATTTINQILYSSANNTVSEITAANNGTLITGATGIPTLLANGTTGQVLAATTGSPPSWSTNPGGWVVGPGSATSTAIPSFSGTTGKLIQDNSFLTVSTTELLLARSNGGASLNFRVFNTSNTASSSAYVTVSSGGSSADDAYYRAIISGVTNWSWGADNSDSDAFVISNNLTLGTNNVLRSATTGEITMPLQPCFEAYNSATDTDVTGDGTVYTIICDTEVVDQNSDYDNTTGIFTAPVTGNYLFTGFVYLTDVGVTHTSASFNLVVTSGQTPSVVALNPSTINITGDIAFNISKVIHLTAAGTAKLTITVSGGTKVVDVRGANDGRTSFSGALIC